MWEITIPLLAGAAGLVQAGRKHQRLKVWQDAVVASGLQVEEASWAVRLRLRAGGETMVVRLEPSGMFTRVVVAVAGPPGFSGVTIRPHPSPLAGVPVFGVGDEVFDSSFEVYGPERLVSALLGAEVRRLLGDVKTVVPLEVEDGEIRAVLPDDRLPALLPLLVRAGRRMAKAGDVRRQLALNLREDPAPGVRLRSLRLLARELSWTPDTHEALRQACLDVDPEVRLGAALELGAEGRGVLLDLADSLVEDAWSARAVASLGRELPFERGKAILAVALRLRRIETALACIAVIGASREVSAVELLTAVLEGEEIRLAVAAAESLAETGDPAAEAPLLRALAGWKPDIQLAAAAALGRVGTVAAVLPLQEAEKAAEGLPELARAARQAIAEIQSRLPGASPGQLSLAQAEAGQLSLAEDRAGWLSLGDAVDSAERKSIQSSQQG